MKHGLTASTVVLDGEDPGALEARVAAWKEDLRPETALEHYLVERAAHNSWQLDRADCAIASRINARMRDAAVDRMSAEVEEVARLGYALFRDPQGPTALYPHDDRTVHPRVSWSRDPEPGLDPAAILARLEATATDCRWLLRRWAELRAVLADGRLWQPPDRFRAARLLGRQPLDALDDDRVMTIHLACQAMDPSGPPAFADVANEMSRGDYRAFRHRAEGRGAKARTPSDPAAGKAALLALIEGAVGRLEGRLVEHDEREAAERSAAPAALAFDDSPEGELMRRYQLSHGRGLIRTINTYFKVRKELARDLGEPGASPDVDPIGDLCDETKPIPGDGPMTPLQRDDDSCAVDETKPISGESPSVDESPGDRRHRSPEDEPRARLAARPIAPVASAPTAPAVGDDRGVASLADPADVPAAGPEDTDEPGLEAEDWEAEHEQVIEGLVEEMMARIKLPSLPGGLVGRGDDVGLLPRKTRQGRGDTKHRRR